MWTNDVVLKLIELFKSYECLWDTSNNDYKNKDKKNDSWEEIADKLNIQRKFVETKVHILRSQFIRERKIIKASKLAGGNTKKTSSWFAYEPLLFLVKGKNISEDMDMKEQILSQNLQVTNNTEKLNSTNENTRKRPSEDTKGYEVCKKKTVERVNTNDFDIYGQYIASELRNIKTEHALVMTKYYINNIIMEARTGRYDTDTNSQKCNTLVSFLSQSDATTSRLSNHNEQDVEVKAEFEEK